MGIWGTAVSSKQLGQDRKRLGSEQEEREAVKVDQCLQKSVGKERREKCGSQWMELAAEGEGRPFR